jgi:hypothetical protein
MGRSADDRLSVRVQNKRTTNVFQSKPCEHCNEYEVDEDGVCRHCGAITPPPSAEIDALCET